MRVRISYGANIEDVPEELSQLFEYVTLKTHYTQRQIKQIQEFLEDNEVESATNLIEKLRISLAEIDNRLSDIQAIGNGYVNYKENEGAEYATEGRPGVDTARDNLAGEPPEQPTGNTYSSEA